MRCNWIFPIGLFVAILPVLSGEFQIELAGRVTDENGAVVAGARVTLSKRSENSRDTTSLQTVCGPGGYFALQPEAPGDYVVSAEREGYFQLRDQPIRLEEGDNDVSLVLNRLREIFETVDVIASAPGINLDQTAPAQTVSLRQIVSVPYPSTNNLRNAMRLLPGVSQDASGGLHVAGGAEEQTSYTLDGFNISDPSTGRFESRLSVEAVESLEVSGDRFSAEHGKGSAGSLAIRSTTGDDKFRYSATNFVPGVESHKGLVIGNWTPRLNFSGPIRRGRAWFSNGLDIHYDKHIVEELPKNQDRTSSWRFSDLLSTQVNLTSSYILLGGFLVNYTYAPRTGLGVLDPMETTLDRRSRQWFAYVKNQVYLGRGTLLEVGYAANRTFSRKIPQGTSLYLLTPEGRLGNYFVDSTRRAGRDQWQASAALPVFERAGSHQFKLGVDLNFLNYHQVARRSGFQHHRSDGTPLRIVVYGGDGRVSRSNTEFSSFVQDSWRVQPGLLFEIGLRHDWDRILGNNNLSPRFGFAWSPGQSEDTKISGGYAILHDATNMSLFTRPQDQYLITTYFDTSGDISRGPAITLYSVGDRHLSSPRYQLYSLGIERRLQGYLLLGVNYSRKRGRDGFTYTNSTYAAPWAREKLPPDAVVDSVYLLGNSRRDIYDAVEVSFRKNFSLRHELMASYTRSRAFSNAVVDVDVDNPLLVGNNVGPMPWDSPNRIVSWGYLPTFWDDWSLAYLLEFHTGYPFSIQDEEGNTVGDVNSHRFPSFFELNLHVEHRFNFRGHHWSGRAGFNNITGHYNPTVVNNNTGSPHFMNLYGSRGRSLNFRVRWLGKS